VIFVTVGTNEARFDRLLHAVEALGGSEELIVQHGPSPVRPRGATCVDYLSFEDLTEHIRRARLVVMHAGVGSILAALANGAKPLVAARLRRFGEAVDDHQVTFARRVHAEGFVQLVEDLEGLPEAAVRHESRFAGAVGLEGRLVEELRDFIRAQTKGGPVEPPF
jgi:UDP-N-acetylglucosamine transferase subunit ALG13